MSKIYQSFVCSFFLFIILFSGCRNAPELPKETWDKTVKVRIEGDSESLGYLYVSDSKAIQIIRQINLPFADFDPKTIEMVPLLAKSLPIVNKITEGEYKGLASYEFEIRPEATWTNGSPVTGKDLLFTLKAIYNPHKPSFYAGQFLRIKDVKIDNENPKKFTIYSSAYIMAGPSYSNVAPLPAYLFDPDGIMDGYSLDALRNDSTLLEKTDLKVLADNMLSPKYLRSPEILQGSGPYKLTEWITGQQIVLTKRKNWWGDALGNNERLLKAIPEKIIYKMIPDANAAISLMKNNELDIMAQMNWTTFLDQKKNPEFNKMVNFYTPDLFAMRVMNFNTNKDVLSDKKVRRAIAHLFNFKEINKTIWYGYSTPIASPIYPTKPAYNKSLKLIDYDLDKAKFLLAEAGWEDSDKNGIMDKKINGEKVELNIDLAFGSGNSDYASIATIFSSKAMEAGVKINPKPIESSTYFDVLKSNNFDITFSGIGDYPFNFDPYRKWHSRGSGNYSAFGTAESDAIIYELQRTIDIDKQNELSKELQAIIYEEQPCIFIGIGKNRIIANKKFGKITMYAISPGFNINEFNGNAVFPVPNKN